MIATNPNSNLCAGVDDEDHPDGGRDQCGRDPGQRHGQGVRSRPGRGRGCGLVVGRNPDHRVDVGLDHILACSGNRTNNLGLGLLDGDVRSRLRDVGSTSLLDAGRVGRHGLRHRDRVGFPGLRRARFEGGLVGGRDGRGSERNIRGGLGDVEEVRVAVTQEQYRRSEFGREHRPDDRAAGRSERGVDRQAAREARVQALAERDRRVVGDLELHADDRGDVEVHETRRHPGERVDMRAARALAGVQDHEPQARLVLQHCPDLLARDVVRATLGRLEHEDAGLGGLVVRAMADVMQDVDLVGLGDPATEFAERRAVEPGHLDQPGLSRSCERPFEVAPLDIRVELRIPRGTAHHREDPQRQADLLGTQRRVDVERPDDGRVRRLGDESRSLVEELPRESHQFGRARQAERDPKTPIPLRRRTPCGVEHRAHVVLDERVEQGRAERPDRLHPSVSRPAPPSREPDSLNEIVELRIAHGRGERPAGGSAVGRHREHPVGSVGITIDAQLEIVVPAGCHHRLLDSAHRSAIRKFASSPARRPLAVSGRSGTSVVSTSTTSPSSDMNLSASATVRSPPARLRCLHRNSAPNGARAPSGTARIRPGGASSVASKSGPGSRSLAHEQLFTSGS